MIEVKRGKGGVFRMGDKAMRIRCKNTLAKNNRIKADPSLQPSGSLSALMKRSEEVGRLPLH